MGCLRLCSLCSAADLFFLPLLAYCAQTKSKRVAVIREITREVCGLAPYEKRCMDMIKLLGGSADKKVYKLLKKRLGTHRRGMIKRELVKRLAQRMRAQGKM
jgi:large subunit ribosomal protein L36e